MPRITDAINDLHVDEATFAKVYEKVMWKKLSSKVATVSDANLEKIKYVVEQLPKKDTKKAEVAPKKNDDWKFLKSGELWFWGCTEKDPVVLGWCHECSGWSACNGHVRHLFWHAYR